MNFHALKDNRPRASTWPAGAILAGLALAAILYSGHTTAFFILFAVGFVIFLITMAFPNFDRIRRRAIREAHFLPADQLSPEKRNKTAPVILGRSTR